MMTSEELRRYLADHGIEKLPADPPPRGGLIAGGGIGSLGHQQWLPALDSGADRIASENDRAVTKRWMGIEKVWQAIVDWFYGKGEPEHEPARMPDYLVPGTRAYRVYRAQQGLQAEGPPPPSREGYRDEETLFFKRAEEKSNGES